MCGGVRWGGGEEGVRSTAGRKRSRDFLLLESFGRLSNASAPE